MEDSNATELQEPNTVRQVRSDNPWHPRARRAIQSEGPDEPPTFFNAFPRYDIKREARGKFVEQLLPENPGITHAVPYVSGRVSSKLLWEVTGHTLLDRVRDDDVAYLRKTRQPLFPSYRLDSWQALCGKRVKVILPTQFKEDDPEVCQSCVTKAYEISQAIA